MATPAEKNISSFSNILGTSIENEILQSFVADGTSDERNADSAKPRVSEEIAGVCPKMRKPSTVKGGDKKKKKGARRRPEELYTDKDRAAAVNMGSKDIKQSLKLKKQQDRARRLNFSEEADPIQFMMLGDYEMSKKEYILAHSYYDKALELNPIEKHALVARSKCYIILGQPSKGLEDAESALGIDKHIIKAIYQKAEALYHLGDFEHSLMYFHRGLHVRPDHEEFKAGVEKARKAIENALGIGFKKKSRSSRATSKASGCSKERKSVMSSAREANNNNNNNEEEVEEEKEKELKNTISMSRDEDVDGKMKVNYNEGEEKKVTVKTRSGNTSLCGKKKSPSKRLLRELAVDKEYLDGLLNNPHIKCKGKENEKDPVLDYIQEAVKYLNQRQEFWRQQLPPPTSKK